MANQKILGFCCFFCSGFTASAFAISDIDIASKFLHAYVDSACRVVRDLRVPLNEILVGIKTDGFPLSTHIEGMRFCASVVLSRNTGFETNPEVFYLDFVRKAMPEEKYANDQVRYDRIESNLMRDSKKKLGIILEEYQKLPLQEINYLLRYKLELIHKVFACEQDYLSYLLNSRSDKPQCLREDYQRLKKCLDDIGDYQHVSVW